MDRTATCVTPERRLRALVVLLVALCACEGRRGPAGPAGPAGDPGGGGPEDPEPTPTAYAPGEAVPEVVVRIEALGGASGSGGEFQVGDAVAVDYALEKTDGSAWSLEELQAGEVLVSGPSFNYQRVLPAAEDLLERSTELSPGHFRYVFADPIPDVYPAPYNDTPSFGFNGGELRGRNLLDGTYSVGLSVVWDFQVAGRPFRRVGEATLDFLLGTGAGPLTPRAVTSAENCARCHGSLRAHDGRYQKLELCLLCHTSGAEDANLAAVEGGTPGVTIDSRVLFHRLHAGRFLPSVNGVKSTNNGNRNYTAAPVPLRFVRADGTVRDFSHVGFPVMANRVEPMPRDSNFGALSPEAQTKEDLMLSAPTRCEVCHGDPDGDGPLEAPAQGKLIEIPSRRACGACHDDVNFAQSYRSNGQIMPPQNNDNRCTDCHDPRFPGDLSPVDAHHHPLDRPEFTKGLAVAFTDLVESGGDSDGTVDPGEGVVLEFALRDGTGAEVQAADLDEVHVVIAGPNSNYQVLYDAAVPAPFLTGAQPFRLTLPERVQLEYLGDSTAALDVFQTQLAPHRRAGQITTDVFVRSGTAGGASTLARAAARRDGFVEVLDPAGFAPGDVIVLDDGVAGREEYLRIQAVEGARLWFAPPNRPDFVADVRHPHAPGAGVLEVQISLRSRFTYNVNNASGTITETAEFGEGVAVLASYTTDWRLPADFPQASNASPELDDGAGKWSGKPLVSGTYEAAVVAVDDFDFVFGTGSTHYRASSPSATRAFLVGDATEPVPHDTIADAASCNACHQELLYHGGTYRGFATCILCHGASGTEDLPPHLAAGAPPTPALSVQFRTLIHKIHRGSELADPDYRVVGAAPVGSPDTFRLRAYDGFSTFPAFPGRTLECARCHGEGNLDALLPSPRKHPTSQAHALQIWRPACATCHDDEPTIAHVDSNTAPNGAEACAICHAAGEFEDARAAHLARLEPR